MKKLCLLPLVLFPAMVLGGCRHGVRRASAPAAAVSSGETVHTYIVRGIVGRLPSPGHPHIHIKSEAIKNFVDFSGKVEGMAPMDMPYRLAQGVKLTAIRPGSKVQFTFTVNWPKNYTAITAIKRLPKDTKIKFGPG